MLAPNDMVEWCELTLREALTDRAPLLVDTAALVEGNFTDGDIPHDEWRTLLSQPAIHLVLVRRSDAQTTRLLLGQDIVLLCVEGAVRSVLCEVDPELALVGAFEAADVWGDEEATSHQILLSAGDAVAVGPETGTPAQLLEWVVEHLEQLSPAD